MLVHHVTARGDTEVKTDISEAPVVHGDTGGILQVVVNLFVNAVQAMGEAGRVCLGLSQETRGARYGAVLVVRDSGPGIPEDKLRVVFDPHFTAKAGERTGQGLSNSQTLIQPADGIITALNALAGGAAFRGWLPAAA